MPGCNVTCDGNTFNSEDKFPRKHTRTHTRIHSHTHTYSLCYKEGTVTLDLPRGDYSFCTFFQNKTLIQNFVPSSLFMLFIEIWLLMFLRKKKTRGDMNDIYLTKSGLNQLTRGLFMTIKAWFILRIDNACKIVTIFQIFPRIKLFWELFFTFYLIGSLCKLL